MFFSFWAQTYASYLEAWDEYVNVAGHPRQANHVGAPRDAQSQKKQGIVEGPRRSTTREAEAARKRDRQR